MSPARFVSACYTKIDKTIEDFFVLVKLIGGRLGPKAALTDDNAAGAA